MSSQANQLQMKQFYEFGPFRVDPTNRLLLRDGEVVLLTSKVFEILLVFLESSGELLEKGELMRRIWPDSFVEEGNLTRNVSTLRKALGESPVEHRYILTIPGYGYRFAPVVRKVTDKETALIIEEHSQSRIVIEDERETADHEANRSRRKIRSVAFAACITLIGVAAVAYFLIRNKPNPGATVKTIAVLPFKPIGEDAGDEYLGSGMADAIITKLSNVREIVVRPTSSVLKYVGGEQDSGAVGRDLRADALLEGSVQKLADRVRVTVQLVRVSDGSPLWAYKCDDQCADLFAVQDSISEQVARALTLKLTSEEIERLNKHHTEDMQAYQYYLKGRFYWNQLTEAGLKKSIEYYNLAIEKDPNYALAYAGLADSYVILGFDFMPPKEVLPKAKEAAIKALALDETLAEAHISMGAVKLFYEWNWSGAEREANRAKELNPSYANAIELNTNYGDSHHFYCQYLDAVGRPDEAVIEIKRALEFDPLSLMLGTELGWSYYNARQYDRAIEAGRSVTEKDANFGFAYLPIGMAYEQKHLYEEAISELNKARALSGDWPGIAAELGYVQAVSGKRAGANKIANQLKQRATREYIDPYNIAIIYTGLGEKDQVFAWLEKAYDLRSTNMIWLKVEPKFDGLRSDPRFTDLLRRIGLS